MRLSLIHTGYLKLDGGAMFGIIPKRMWEKLNPPDDKNLCTWSMRCLLIETDDRKILVDTGMGDKQDARFRSHFEPHGQLNIAENLAQYGIQAEDITDVFLTHLHFDHCGGAISLTPSVKDSADSTKASPTAYPTFPNAKYWTNAPHWAWAMSPNPREQASFLKENFAPLKDWGLLHFIQDGEELAQGVKVHYQYGHTEAMMALEIQNGDKTFFYCADTIPSAWHVHLPFVMAYDVRPLDTLAEKKIILERAVTEGWYLIFEHDPLIECASIQKSESGRYMIDKTFSLNDLSA